MKNIIPGVGYMEGIQNAQNSANFCDFLRKRGKQYKAAEQIDAGLKCGRMAWEINAMLGRDAYAVDINADFILQYITWCKKSGNQHNTIMRKIKNLRTIYKQAAKRGLAPLPNPFEDYKINLQPVNRNKLTGEQIKKIEELQLPAGDTICVVRDAFLISFYCQGMRFENVCLLRWQDVWDGHIHYQMNKGKRWRAIAIHPKLQRLLDRYKGNEPYILPFFKEPIKDKVMLRNKKGSANAIANNFLKIIADMAGIPLRLQFHEARHTFAWLAKTSGISTDTIKDALGQGDTRITEVYLKSLDDDVINNAVRAVYE
jgi:integrase